MKIYLYSHTYKLSRIVNGIEVNVGGGHDSTLTTIKYLSKIDHDVNEYRHISELKKAILKDKPDVVLHHNIFKLVEVSKVCRKLNVPIIATINNLISDVNGLHVIMDDSFGKPYKKCTFLKGFFLTITQKKIHTPFHKLISILLYPYRFYKMKLRIRILNKIDGVIATSPTLAELLKLNGVKRKI